MIFHPLGLAGAFRITPQLMTDERGAFARRFCADTFRARGLEADLVQRSISFNARAGTLRGLHFQAPPHLETKIVRCARGAIFDVIVDLRDSSPTYGQWHGEELTADNRLMLYIPKGFAHGFQSLEDNTEVDYEITPAYVPDAGAGFRFDDPILAIDWPVANIIISERDRALPPSFAGIRL
ncbi:dTDP-4-dehydrorhamnose 3,5-epimerase [Bradyrhizobium sacchari]|uniref:dTDP-4-dehydrorhamnose 3,5-epimerase n=1 Tax=Bradyrhizobium sacchari TaxID=1399419 RepID=A0A560JNA3_9BRAD|nr:dTDP-4-dehydrorhamnose 3,5-epimerase [Bradyrhizobium sacchari]OPY97885.1 dTDP-4-dehydrorhamnose 3,5-epimerase [Bradyrhizobium sacchari]TWB59184.1 dTDP-4-dehydrorhamnose 3,5-epimerase [Bradyrhizobium sacchari]TWB72456.1 dTDP-4-dehydrorhamnose 3,5-epimerase [Bradyrhizobium sacchari]